jgi:transcriptional regulator with XRE-family HTH domain
MNNIAETIKTLRKRNGISQEQLAENLYVSRQAISKWERGETTPDIDTLVLLSQQFNISVDELISGQNILENQDYISTTNPHKIMQAKNLKKKVNLIFIASIILYILSPLTFLLNLSYKNITLIFGGIIVIATTLMIIYSNLQHQYKELTEGKKDHKLSDNISGAVSILSAIIFLILGFLFDLWHPGWIVFLFIPFAWIIADLFESHKN